MRPARSFLTICLGVLATLAFAASVAAEGKSPPDISGVWDGDTLVVETTLIEEWLMPRWAHTRDARVVERFDLVKSSEAPRADRGNYRDFGPLDEDVLVDELTMYDSAIYSTPPSIRVYYRRLRDDEFLENNCSEGLWWDVMETLRKPQMSSVTLTGQ